MTDLSVTGGPVSSQAWHHGLSARAFTDAVAAVASEGEECWRTGTPLNEREGWPADSGPGFLCALSPGHDGRHRTRPFEFQTFMSAGSVYEWEPETRAPEKEEN